MPVKDCLTPLSHNLQVETPDSNPRAVGEHSSCEVEKHVGPVVSTESLCYWCKYVNCLLKQEVLVSLRCTCHILLCFFFTVQACWSPLCGWRWHWPSCLHSETAGVSHRTCWCRAGIEPWPLGTLRKCLPTEPHPSPASLFCFCLCLLRECVDNMNWHSHGEEANSSGRRKRCFSYFHYESKMNPILRDFAVNWKSIQVTLRTLTWCYLRSSCIKFV